MPSLDLVEIASSASRLNPEHPFPGLRPFNEEDADWFFGRSAEINQLLKLIRRTRFVAVVGPSGCGKSSLIKAGLLPSIRDGYLDANWSIAILRPGDAPINNLAEALKRSLGDESQEVRTQLRSGSGGLVKAIKARAFEPDRRVFLLVDQFEELFEFSRRHGDRSQEESKAFLKLLLTAASSEEVRFYLVITMRMEWLSECASYEGVAEAINEGIYLIPQMSRRQFQQVILNPIKAAGGSITTTLLDQMLNDLAGRSDQLPVLQHALMRLWICRDPGEPLDMAHYELVGTFSNSLSDHAEEIYRKLTSEQKTIAEALFRSITQVYNNRKIRRPRLFSELAAMPGMNVAQLREVIDAFGGHGRSFLFVSEGPMEESSVIDISHEALMRQWRRLADWVDDEAEIQGRLARLKEDAAEWESGNRKDSSALYSGYRLERAWALWPRSDQSSTTLAFLRAGRNASRRQALLSRGLLALPLLVLIVLWQWLVYSHVKQARDEALSERAAAQTAKDAAQAALTQVRRGSQVLSTVKQELSGSVRDSQALASIEKSITAQRVYMQYVGDDGLGLAKQAGSLLRNRGYVVPGYEKVAARLSPSSSQVRYFHPEDKNDAVSIASIVAGAVNGPVTAVQTANPNNLVSAGQFEVWLAQGATGAQQ